MRPDEFVEFVESHGVVWPRGRFGIVYAMVVRYGDGSVRFARNADDPRDVLARNASAYVPLHRVCTDGVAAAHGLGRSLGKCRVAARFAMLRVPPTVCVQRVCGRLLRTRRTLREQQRSRASRRDWLAIA